MLLVALGIDGDGHKHFLGLMSKGATDNAAAVDGIPSEEPFLHQHCGVGFRWSTTSHAESEAVVGW